MYGNNVGGPFMYGPMMNSAPMMGSTMMRSAPMMGSTMMRSTPIMGGSMMRGTGTMGARGGLGSLFGIGRTAGAGAGSFNLGSLLNGASKALGVVNQAIPIVKEVGPMMNNMRSMLKIASIFKDETDSSNSKTTTNTNNNTSNNKEDRNERVKEANNIKDSNTDDSTTIIKSNTNNEPNFFL